MAKLTFNLKDYRTSSTSKVFSGRPRGEEVRQLMDLKKHDEQRDEVTIVVPPDTYSVNMSFFLGLFSDSIKHWGGKEGFLRQYHFDAPPQHLSALMEYVDEAMNESIGLPQKKRAA